MMLTARAGVFFMAIVLLVVIPTARSLGSTPLQVDGPWIAYSHSFSPGTEVGALAPNGPFSFTSTQGVVLQTTDTHQTGEEFSIFLGLDDTGPLLLDTPLVEFNVGPGLLVTDPDVTFADPRWSSGEILFAPGSYTVSVRQNAALPGYTFWNLAIRVISAADPTPTYTVPEDTPTPTPTAHTAVLIVTKPFDTNDGTCDADCSLREAVITANLNPGMDEILIQPSVLVLAAR